MKEKIPEVILNDLCRLVEVCNYSSPYILFIYLFYFIRNFCLDSCAFCPIDEQISSYLGDSPLWIHAVNFPCECEPS